MATTNWIWETVSWLSLPILGLLAAVIVRRKLHRDFSFFFGYVLMAGTVGILRYAVYRMFSPLGYFYVYWLSDFVIYGATLLALYETLIRRSFPGFSRIRFYRYLFPTVISILVLLAFFTIMKSRHSVAMFFLTSRTLDLICSAVIAFFVLLLLFMGRRLTGLEFSIALGFGIQASVVLATAAVTTRVHYGATIVRNLEPIGYDLACIIWLIAFWRAEKVAQTSRDIQISPEVVQEAKSWESSLKDLVKPKKRSE